MSKYKRYKKDSTIEQKVLQKYGLGGLLNKVGEGFANYGKAVADQAMSVVGLEDVITEDDYKGFGSKAFGKYTNTMGKITKTAAPIVANMVAPGSGQFISAGQNVGSQFNPKIKQSEEARIGNTVRGDIQSIMQNQMIHNMMSPQTYKCGGRMKKYQMGGEFNEYNGLTHEEGGIPISDNAEVEDGETRIEDFIFSNSIPFTNKKTFADESKKINKKYSLRPNDNFSIEARNKELKQLARQQEAVKELDEAGFGIKYKKHGKMEIKPSEKVNSKFTKNFIKKNNDRTKYQLGGNYTRAELIKKGAVKRDTAPGKGWIEITADVLDLGTGEKFWMTEGAVANFTMGKYNSDVVVQKGDDYWEKFIVDQASKGIRVPEDKLRAGFVKSIEEKHNLFKQKNPKFVYTTDTITPPETKKTIITQAAPKEEIVQPDYSYETEGLDPIGLDWGAILSSGAGSAVAAVGNLFNKIKYPRVAPDQIRTLGYDLNPILQDIQGQTNAQADSLRQSGLSKAGIIAATTSLAGTGARQKALAAQKANQINMEESNRTQRENVALREKAKYTNVDLNIKEREADFNRKSAAITSTANMFNTMAEEYGRQRYIEDMRLFAHPDYIMGINPKTGQKDIGLRNQTLNKEVVNTTANNLSYVTTPLENTPEEMGLQGLDHYTDFINTWNKKQKKKLKNKNLGTDTTLKGMKYGGKLKRRRY